MDSEGFLWSARFDGSRVLRHSPDGEVVDEIELPVSRVTSCALGGPELKTLYVTTAFFRLTEDQRLAEPRAGALFAVEVDVSGLPSRATVVENAAGLLHSSHRRILLPLPYRR